MVIEISEFIWQNIAIGNYVELFFSVFLLHFDQVCNKSILSSRESGLCVDNPEVLHICVYQRLSRTTLHSNHVPQLRQIR